MRWLTLGIAIWVAAIANSGCAADVEEVLGPARARLVFSQKSIAEVRDPRDKAGYRAVCGVEIAEKDSYARRFVVHIPDPSYMPFARRTGRFLAILWGMADRRYGTECGRLRDSVVDVWMTQVGDPGGELLTTNLYINDLSSERTGIEWARELAHEYGHYLLPSPSGYSSPESWANGVLGERLFLSWLHEDIQAGRIDVDEVPYVRLADLKDYCAKQVTPLIADVRESGPKRTVLGQRDKAGFNAFTGLILYADATYGSRSLMRMLEFLPRRASGEIRAVDFLAALTTWLDSASEFRVASTGGPTMVYLPAGSFDQFREKIAVGAPPVLQKLDRIIVKRSGWQHIFGYGVVIHRKVSS